MGSLQYEMPETVTVNGTKPSRLITRVYLYYMGDLSGVRC